MVDISRAVRQFERTFLPHLNPNEPPDDRKTMDDMMRYPRQPQPSISAEEQGELIATIVYTYIRDAQGRLVDIQQRVECPEKYSK